MGQGTKLGGQLPRDRREPTVGSCAKVFDALVIPARWVMAATCRRIDLA